MFEYQQEENNHSLWVEKYRPNKLEDYVGNEHLKAKVEGYLESGDVPHLLLYGKAGTGKTTLAKLIIKNIQCDYLYLNASDENGIDVGEFASKHGGGGHKHAAGFRKESSWEIGLYYL